METILGIEVLPREREPEALLHEAVETFERQVQVRIEIRRDVSVMRLKVFVFVAAEKARDPLCKAEIIIVEMTDVLQSRQLVASDRI